MEISEKEYRASAHKNSSALLTRAIKRPDVKNLAFAYDSLDSLCEGFILIESSYLTLKDVSFKEHGPITGNALKAKLDRFKDDLASIKGLAFKLRTKSIDSKELLKANQLRFPF